MGWWAEHRARSEARVARMQAGEGFAGRINTAMNQVADQLEQAKVAKPVAERNVSFNGVITLVDGELVYVTFGSVQRAPVAGARAHVEESGSVLRQNRLVVEGPGFYWEYKFSPRTTIGKERFLMAVNTQGRVG